MHAAPFAPSTTAPILPKHSVRENPTALIYTMLKIFEIDFLEQGQFLNKIPAPVKNSKALKKFTRNISYSVG
jgi:hypothetical protein